MKKFGMVAVLLGLAVVTWLANGTQGVVAQDGPAETPKWQQAYDSGLAYLASQQTDEGAWAIRTRTDAEEPHVGVSALALTAFSTAPDAYRAKYKANMDKAAEFIAKHQNEDGSFSDPHGYLKNYNTSVAVMALAPFGDKYADVVAKAREFIIASQQTEGMHLGGFGYGDKKPDGTERDYADMSNTGFALDALKAAGVSEDSDVWKRAVKFVEACQNRTENEELTKELAAKGHGRTNDGGMIYKPDESKAGTEEKDGVTFYKSYGSMTYMGIKSFIYAGISKDDPRVQAALHWIKQHYTLEENPGLRTDERPDLGQQGLFYYYYCFVKALDAYADEDLVDANGDKHNWAMDIANHLASLQKEDGSWINEVDRWYEGDPKLVTAYVIMTYNGAWSRLK